MNNVWLRLPVNELLFAFAQYRKDSRFILEDLLMSWVSYRVSKDYGLLIECKYEWSFIRDSIQINEVELSDILHRVIPIWVVKELEGDQWIMSMNGVTMILMTKPRQTI